MMRTGLETKTFPELNDLHDMATRMMWLLFRSGSIGQDGLRWRDAAEALQLLVRIEILARKVGYTTANTPATYNDPTIDTSTETT